MTDEPLTSPEPQATPTPEDTLPEPQVAALPETTPTPEDTLPEPQVAALPEAAPAPEDTLPEPQVTALPETTPAPEDTLPEPQVAALPEESAPLIDDAPGQPASPQDFAAPPPPPPQQSYCAPVGAVPLSVADERTWAMLAHLSVLANLLGFLVIPFGPVIALLIYLIYRERSRYVAYQSLQAFVFQLVWWVGGGLLTATAWGISSALTVVLIGLCLMPFACLVTLMPLVALIYGIVAGVEVSQGRDFKYWLIGDWVHDTWTGA